MGRNLKECLSFQLNSRMKVSSVIDTDDPCLSETLPEPDMDVYDFPEAEVPGDEEWQEFWEENSASEADEQTEVVVAKVEHDYFEETLKESLNQPPPKPRKRPEHSEGFECCNAVWKSRDTFQSHMASSHADDIDYDCHGCCPPDGFPFGDCREAYVNHVILVHIEPTKNKCPECGKNFLSEAQLRKHRKNLCKDKKKDICDLCGATVKRFTLKTHKRRVHAKEKRHYCDKCGKGFFTIPEVRLHVSRVHEKRRDAKCEQCGKFYSACDLSQHIKSVHEKHNYKHKCDHCERRFETKTHKRYHTEQVHLGIKRFKCDHCEVMFYKKTEARYHQRIVHDKEKKHLCTICGFSFGWPALLIRHMREVHKKETAAKCGKCKKEFKRKEELKKHNCHIKEMPQVASLKGDWTTWAT